MSQVLIPCPKCGKELRLRDRSLLGKKGKCPSCQHTFVLEEPDEVQLELAEAAPAVGTAARWVPDAPVLPAASHSPAPVAARAPSLPPVAASPVAAVFSNVVADDDAGARMREARRRKARKRNITMAVCGVAALLLIGGGFGLYAYNTGDTLTADNASKGSSAAVDNAGSDASEGSSVTPTKPTDGKPIDLKMLPAGSGVVIHLRVADLWQQGGQGEEFRYCLGPLAEFTEARLKQYCLFEPAAIDTVLFSLIYQAPGEPPLVAGVVRLKDAPKRSELIGKFGGEPSSESGYPIYKTEKMAYAIFPSDPKTFGFCPESLASEMVDGIKSANSTVPGIEELVEYTDRDRSVTVVFRPDDARIHEQAIVPENMLPFFGLFLDWLNPDEVESVAWSVHVADTGFHSEMVLRNKAVIPPPRLKRDLRKRLDELPGELLAAVEKMDPAELGKRQVIGRFPAMMQVFSVESNVTSAERTVSISTPLPERAAPNLALGALLAWDESTRTDFSKEKAAPVKPGAPTSQGAETIVAKLNKKIEIDFRKTPLQEAIAYIGGETNVTTEIDGEGLKFSGYTKNMAQDMKLGLVPAIDALKEILSKYKGKTNDRDDMCIVVEEDKKLLTLTTKGGADRLGKKPYDIGK